MTKEYIASRRILLDTRSSHIRYNAELSFGPAGIHSVKSSETLDLGANRPDTLIIPAFANAHDHGRGLKTLAYGVSDAPVEAWVPSTYTLPNLDPYLIAATAFARMARAGIASVVHCHLSSAPDQLLVSARAVRRAAKDVGIRVAFVVPLRDRNRLGYGPDERVLGYIDANDREAVGQRWLRPIPSIEEQLETFDAIAAECEDDCFHVQYGPIGAEWCSDDLLSRIADRSNQSGRRVHMHLLESRYQREWSDSFYPGGLVKRLGEIGILSPRLTVAHGTWLTRSESDRLAEYGATVSVNTSSNLRLRSGIAPFVDMTHAGLKIAIGLDALALDDDDDIMRELRLTYLLHNAKGFDAPITPATVLHAACHTGASAACGDAHCGGKLDVGAAADFLILDYEKMSNDAIDGIDNALSIFFARARTEHIRSVYVAGREIVSGGNLVGVDLGALESELHKQFKAAAPDLIALRPLVERYQAGLKRYYQSGGHRSQLNH